ncbi:MAG: phospholipase D-like domain-containing protein, partial [Rhodospirillaceae bacterium]
GLQFINALVDAHKRGVAVRVLLDDEGLRYSPRPVDSKLKRAGVATARFIPRRLRYLPFLNLRNHRKFMVVDGQTAFIGGMNIRHGNLLAANPRHPVRDIHFRVIGPVIEQINALFEEDWLFAAGEDIKLPSWTASSGDSSGA